MSVANRTLELDKRPTSYGNSNSVQVFSSHTFAAQRALDWPGEQPGPQERVKIHKNKTGSCPDLFSGIFQRQSCRNGRDRSPVTLHPCTTPAKTTEERHPGTGMSFPPHQPEQVDREGRLHLKCQLLSLLLWQPRRWKCDSELSVSGRC